MPTVTWTLGGNTVTFDRGNVRGPHRFDESRIASQRLAGGAIAAYELSGLSPLEFIEFEHPHCSLAVRDAALNFKNNVAKDRLNTFTLTDNSENPALVKTCRLDTLEIIPERYTDPTLPRFTIRGRLQVEPA